MGPTAELQTEIGDFDDTNPFSVLFPEEGHRPPLKRFVEGQYFGLDSQVLLDLLVDPSFDLLQLACGERCEVREVETKPIGSDERACLLYVGPEGLA